MRKSTGIKVILFWAIVVVALGILLVSDNTISSNNFLSVSGPVMPVAYYGMVIENGQIVTSGEVRCYKDGADISQDPSSISQDGKYGYGSDVMICLGVADSFRITTNGISKVYPQVGSINVIEPLDVGMLNLVDGNCDNSCKQILKDSYNNKWVSSCSAIPNVDGGSLYKRKLQVEDTLEIAPENGYIIVEYSRIYSYFNSESECSSASVNDINEVYESYSVDGSSCVQKYTLDENNVLTKAECEDKYLFNYICEDTDNGNDFFVKGSVKSSIDGGFTFNEFEEDLCGGSDGNFVIEKSCVEGKISETPNYCTNGCSDGRCLTEAEVICIDNDVGLDEYFIKSTTIHSIDGGITYDRELTDRCSGDTLLEFKCQNAKNIYKREVECTNGCADGACIKSIQDGVDEVEELVDANYYCIDSDVGADDEFIKGTTMGSIDGGATFYKYNIDTCVDNNKLSEYLCEDDQLNIKEVNCDYGCSSGVCLPQPVEDEVEEETQDDIIEDEEDDQSEIEEELSDEIDPDKSNIVNYIIFGLLVFSIIMLISSIVKKR